MTISTPEIIDHRTGVSIKGGVETKMAKEAAENYFFSRDSAGKIGDIFKVTAMALCDKEGIFLKAQPVNIEY